MASTIIFTPSGVGGSTTFQTSETAARVATVQDATDTFVMRATVDTLTNKTIGAGTGSVPPLLFTSGTNMTTASAGAFEFDGVCFYSAPVASARGVSPSVMYSIVATGGFALQTTAGVQSCFAATGDVWTLAASTTYKFEGTYWIQKATNSVSVAMAFATGGGASLTSILYTAWGQNTAADTTGTTPQMTNVDTNASTVVAAASTTNVWISFRGLLRTNAAGTWTPQINFSGTAAGTPTMLANSYIMFTPIGTNTNNILGNVG